MNKLRRNAEGYPDPTASRGIQRASREEDEALRRVAMAMEIVKATFAAFGLRQVDRILIEDLRTGRRFK